MMINDNQFLTTRDETEAWLKKMGISKYTINDYLTVDVKGDVYIADKNLKYIPVQFGIVTGFFWCNGNNLTTLKGCPHTVAEDFDCSNNKITSLKGCPNFVGGYFSCNKNKLKSLKYTTAKVNGSYYCDNNQLTTLKDLSTQVGGSFYCYNNPITDFTHLEFEVKENIGFTPIEGMDHLDYLKDNDGNVDINFIEFKRFQGLKQLNDKLNNDLSITSVKIKHKI